MFQQIFWSFFSSFSSELWVSCGGIQTPGRKDGRKETCVRAGSLCRSMKNRLDVYIPFFLSYGAPLARAFGPRGSSAKIHLTLISCVVDVLTLLCVVLKGFRAI